MHPFFRIILYIFWISLSFYGIYYQLSENKQFEKEGINIFALITDLQREDDDDGNVSYYPILKFEEQSGKIVEFKSSVSDSKHLVGDSLEITYLKDDPRHARVISFSSSYTGIIIGGIFGFLGFLFAILDISFSIVRKRNAEKRGQLRIKNIENTDISNSLDKKNGSAGTAPKPNSSDKEKKN